MRTRKAPLNRMYKKLLISYVLLVVVTISLISFTLFRQFSMSSADEIADMSLNMLTQTSFASDLIYRQSLQVANQMIGNTTIFSAMYAKEQDYQLQYHVAIELKNIKNVYPFIHTLGIYNGNLRRYVDYLNSGYTDDKLTEKMILDNKPGNSYVYFPRTIRYVYNTNAPEKNVVTFILYPSMLSTDNHTAAFVINIDESYLRKTIQDIYSDKNDTVMILDSKGIVISDTENDQFMQDYSQKAYVASIFRDVRQSGHFLENLNGSQNLVSFVKSNNLGWTFISIRSYSNLIGNIERLRNTTLGIAALLAFTGIFISFLMTRNVYNPVKALMKRIGSQSHHDASDPDPKNEMDYLSHEFQFILNKATSLESAMDVAYPALVNTYFNCLLKGKTDVLSENLQQMSDLDRALTGMSFSVLCLKIDESVELTENSKSEKQVESVSPSISPENRKKIKIVRDLSEDILGVIFDLNVLDSSEDTLVLLLKVKEASQFDGLTQQIKKLQTAVKQALPITISIGCGDVVQTKDEIRNSYITAQEFLKYRFFYGADTILQYDLLKERMARNDKYDYGIEKKLGEAIQLQHVDIVKQTVSDFMESISKASYPTAELFSSQLMISILKQFNAMMNPNEEEGPGFYRDIQKLPDIATFQDMKSHIEDYCLRICSVLQARNDNRSMAVVLQVRAYLDEKYAMPDLSLESMADQVHLSAGYLGMLFKAYSGFSFGDYLIKVRMEKAKQLLSTTDMITGLISEKVGILNSTYFFTLFKKTYGMTPTQFRKKNN